MVHPSLVDQFVWKNSGSCFEIHFSDKRREYDGVLRKRRSLVIVASLYRFSSECSLYSNRSFDVIIK